MTHNFKKDKKKKHQLSFVFVFVFFLHTDFFSYIVHFFLIVYNKQKKNQTEFTPTL